MKKFYLALFFAGFISISLSFAQKIPFQGRLLETGIPVDGTRDFDFSIDVDGNIWTESHLGVAVTEGLYSVVLGSITPLPSDLFKEVESRDLNISVGGTPMSPIQVFAPPTSYYFENSDDTDMRPALHAVMSGNTTGWATIEGESYADTDANGIYGFGGSAVDGTSSGVYGRAQGAGKYNKGLYGYGLGTGNGDTGTGFGEGSINFGVEGNANGNTWNNTGVEGSNFGTAGEWNFGVHGISNAGTGPAVENHGVAGRAFGPGINYGVYGQANGGPDNRGAYFEAIDGAATNNVGVWIETAAGGDTGNAIYSKLDVEGSNSVQSSGIFNVVVGNSPVGGEFRGVQSQVYTTGGGMNSGVRAYAGGDGINRGIWSTAELGTENWAGWFEGDVKVTGTLSLDGSTSTTSNSGSGQTGDQITQQLDVGGDGTGRHYGMLISANSPSGRQNNGIRADAYGPGNIVPTGFSKNTGGEFFAQDNQDTNIGVQGVAWGTAGAQNYGGSFSSTTASAGTNYGIRSEASGGAENWAGWFDGDVMITGNLVSSSGNPLQFNNGGGDLRAEMALESDGGVFNAYGSGNQLVAAIGASNTNDTQGFMGVFNSSGGVNGFMKVQDDGAGGEKGRLVVYNNVDGKSVTLDGGRGDLNIYGSSKKNTFLGSKWWENPDHGMMVLYGSVEIDDGGGPYLPDLVALETIDAGGGDEMGRLILRNTDGSTFEIDANGLGPVSALSNSAMDINVKDPGWDPGNAGFMHIRADTPASTDGTRAAIESYNDGSGNSWGSLGLLASVFNDPGCVECPRNFITMEPRRDPGGSDPSGWAGNIDTYGTNSPNVLIGSRGYQNHDIPQIQLYGNIPDGGGWFHEHANFSVNEDGSQQWGSLVLRGNDGDHNIELGTKYWEDPTVGAQRPYLNMQGSVNDDDLVWMDVYDAGSGNEAGAIYFRSTYGTELGLNADGLSSSRDNGGGMALYANIGTATGGPGGAVYGDLVLSDDLGNSTRMEGYGDMELSASSNSNIRMYADFNRLDAGGNRAHLAVDHANGSDHVWIWGSGDVTATGNMNALAFNTTSDVRYKKNIQTLNNALTMTKKLRGVTYNWKVEEFNNKNFNDQKQVGLIAQEVEEVLPELVHTDENGMKSVNYSQMVAVLIEAVKELNSKIESLESENAELRASLDKSSTNSEQIKSLQKQINTLVALMGSGQMTDTDIQVTGEEK